MCGRFKVEEHTGCTASSAPTRRMQSAWDTQMRVQGVISLSASITMNLHDIKLISGLTNQQTALLPALAEYISDEGTQKKQKELDGRSRACMDGPSTLNGS